MRGGGPPAAAGAHLRSTFRHGLVYGLGMVAAKAVGFVMLPIYTRVLTPADYGVLELLGMTVDVLALVTGVGLTWSVTRYYWFYDDPARKDAVVSSALILMVVSFGLASAVALPFAADLARVVLGDPAHAGLVALAIAGFFLTSFVEIPLAWLRARQDSTRVVAVGIARLVLALGLNVLFLVVLEMGVAGVFYSTILASGAAGAYLAATTLGSTGLTFSGPVARKLLAYGAPIVAANVGSFAMHYSDRYFLRAHGSLEAVGLYSLAYKFAMLIAVFIANPFALIWAPKALEIDKTEGARAGPILRTILDHYVVVLVTAALAISLLAGDAIRVMASPEFHGAGATVPLLCLGILFFGYLQIAYIGPSIRERSDIIAAGAVVGGVVVLGANLLLIPRFQAWGAACATLAAFAAQFLVVRWGSERVYPLRYPRVRLVRPVVLAAGVYALVEGLLGADVAVLPSVAARGAGLVLFVGLLAVSGDLPAAARGWASRVPRRLPFAAARSVEAGARSEG